MRSAESLFADESDVEELGLACSRLSERYYKAALYAFRLDRTVIPYLKGELRKRARWYAQHESWPQKTRKATEIMVCIAIYELEKGGVSEEKRSSAVPLVHRALKYRRFDRIKAQEKAEAIGVSRATWFRNYAKPYEAIYGDLVGWAFVGRAHVFREYNIEELE